MLPEFFQSPTRVRDLRSGRAGALVASFAEKLVQDGYAELTARRHLRSAEHLAHWASRVYVALDGPIEPILDGFDRHLRRRRQCPGHAGRPFGHTFRVQILCGARLFLNHLADANLVSHHRDNRVVSFPPLFVSFCRWMQQQRGTCDSTVGELRDPHLRVAQTSGRRAQPMGCSQFARVHHGGQSDMRVGGSEEAHHSASNVPSVSGRRGPVRQRSGWSDSYSGPSTPLVPAALLGR